MLSTGPRQLLMATAVALPLAAALDSERALGLVQSGISLGISEAMAGEVETPQGTFEYVQRGTERILRARGVNLDALHTLACNEFVQRVEEELKQPGAQLMMQGFKTNVRFEEDAFVFEYAVQLVPAPTPQKAETLVSMRGTVLVGPYAQEGVLAENARKIPDWQARMRETYPDRELHYALVTSEESSPQGILFHEAVLVRGR